MRSRPSFSTNCTETNRPGTAVDLLEPGPDQVIVGVGHRGHHPDAPVVEEPAEGLAQPASLVRAGLAGGHGDHGAAVVRLRAGDSAQLGVGMVGPEPPQPGVHGQVQRAGCRRSPAARRTSGPARLAAGAGAFGASGHGASSTENERRSRAPPAKARGSQRSASTDSRVCRRRSASRFIRTAAWTSLRDLVLDPLQQMALEVGPGVGRQLAHGRRSGRCRSAAPPVGSWRAPGPDRPPWSVARR